MLIVQGCGRSPRTCVFLRQTLFLPNRNYHPPTPFPRHQSILIHLLRALRFRFQAHPALIPLYGFSLLLLLSKLAIIPQTPTFCTFPQH
jgi:hypothetical protein